MFYAQKFQYLDKSRIVIRTCTFKRFLFKNHVVIVPERPKKQQSSSSNLFSAFDYVCEVHTMELFLKNKAKSMLDLFNVAITSGNSTLISEIATRPFGTFIQQRKPLMEKLLSIDTSDVTRVRMRIGKPVLWNPFLYLGRSAVNRLCKSQNVVIVWREEILYDALVSLKVKDPEDSFIGDTDDFQISRLAKMNSRNVPVADVRLTVSTAEQELRDVYVRLERPENTWLIGDIDFIYTSPFLQQMNLWFGAPPSLGKRRRILTQARFGA